MVVLVKIGNKHVNENRPGNGQINLDSRSDMDSNRLYLV